MLIIIISGHEVKRILTAFNRILCQKETLSRTIYCRWPSLYLICKGGADQENIETSFVSLAHIRFSLRRMLNKDFFSVLSAN